VLGAFGELRKATTGFGRSALSIRTEELGVYWTDVRKIFAFIKICQENSNSVEIGRKYEALCMQYVLLCQTAAFVAYHYNRELIVGM
jgi:hypothetical protein